MSITETKFSELRKGGCFCRKQAYLTGQTQETEIRWVSSKFLGCLSGIIMPQEEHVTPDLLG